jgi:hypothetical protein
MSILWKFLEEKTTTFVVFFFSVWSNASRVCVESVTHEPVTAAAAAALLYAD